MKTMLKVILTGVVLLAAAWRVFAYPPDNAAVLYYKAFMLMEEPNDAVGKMLKGLSHGDIKLNEQIRKYVENNRKVIKVIVTAAEIKNCDWGNDFSEGFNMPLPELAKYRNTAYLLTADAKELAEKGDYKTALERCMTIHKMGIHLGGDIIISRLVGNAIGGLANKCIVDILPQVSGDCEMLEQLRTHLADISRRIPSMKTAIGSERKIFLENPMDSKGIIEAIHNSGLSKDDLDKADKVFRQHEENEFYIKSTEYYSQIISRMQMAYDLPYPDAKQKLEDLYGEVKNAAKEKPEAVVAEVLFPAISGVLTKDTREKTQFNAVLAAIDIYLIRAKTGKLPDEMPAGLPKDLLSGKDFLYAKTDAGFTLTGQGKDLDKDIIQKYEFKVVK